MSDSQPAVTLSDIDSAPVVLEAPAGPINPQDVESLSNSFSQVSNENFQLKEEIEALKKRVRTAEILDALITPYAHRAYGFMCFYCSGVAGLLLLSGSSTVGFELHKDVLVLMVGSTAVTVIGLVGMVLTGIFVGARNGSR